MRFCAVVIALSFFAFGLVRAQSNPPANSGAAAHAPQALSILTPAQQMEYAQARAKALTDNPDLSAENDALKAQYAQVMAHGTAAEKQAMLAKADSHRQKLQQAMLKVDPNLGPVFAAIDKYIADQRAKGAGAGN